MDCEACTKPVKDNNALFCTCKAAYHFKCVSLTPVQYNKLKNKNSWKCPKCTLAKSRKGDETPVRVMEDAGSESSDHSPAWCSHQSCIPTEDLESYLNKYLLKINKNINAVKEEILTRMTSFKQEQYDEFMKLNNQLREVQNSQETMKAELELSLQNLGGFYDKIKSDTDALTQENSKMKKQINKMTTQIRDLELQAEETQRYISSNSIEIRHVPVYKQENLSTYLQKLCETLKVKYNDNYITNIYRKRTQKPDMQHIIVEFNNRMYKQNLLSTIKDFNRRSKDKLNTTHLGITGTVTNVYASELLSARAKDIFYKTRDYAKNNNFKFCWTNNGRVYLRKQEGSKAILVRSIDQLTGAVAETTNETTPLLQPGSGMNE